MSGGSGTGGEKKCKSKPEKKAPGLLNSLLRMLRVRRVWRYRRSSRPGWEP